MTFALRCLSARERLGKNIHQVRRALYPLAALVVLVAGLSCSDEGPESPMPGVLAVRVTIPNTGDRAIRLSLTGGAVLGVRSPSNALVVHSALTESGALVLAFGSLESGVVAEIDVPDVRLAADYQATIVDVAGTDFALRALGGYSATVEH